MNRVSTGYAFKLSIIKEPKIMKRLIFLLCVTPALAFAGPIGAGAQGQGSAAIRFAAMDTNRDRVITRAEWTGTGQSFRTHDWNNDGVLSGDEVRPGAQQPVRNADTEFDSADREYILRDWTAERFANLDHNRDGRVTRDEWHFDRESFTRADHNRDTALSRAEFLGTDSAGDDVREDRFGDLDANGDGRITRGEWLGDRARFDLLDDNRDGVLTRTEALGTTEPPPELFTSVDVNRDRAITRNEWHWSPASFDRLDANRDGRLSREEFTGAATQGQQTAARKAGYDRGVIEGRTAGREDKERNQGWDLEGQRELETADSGYEPRMGSKAEYQAGYREGFRKAYREGWYQK